MLVISMDIATIMNTESFSLHSNEGNTPVTTRSCYLVDSGKIVLLLTASWRDALLRPLMLVTISTSLPRRV